MAWDTSMSALSAGTYGAPGFTIAEIKTQIQYAVGWETPTAAQNTKMYEAMTAAGQSAATWQGEDWWWLRGTNDFDTVATTASYALRTVNSSAMASLWAVQAVTNDDDWPLAPMSYRDYRAWYNLQRPTAGTGKALAYGVTGEVPYLWIQPIPVAAETLYVSYIMRHSKLAGATNDDQLIVPAEFQHGIYVQGATWLLRHEKQDIASLKDCPGFMEAIERMVANVPEGFDKKPINQFSDSVGTWPHNRKVMEGLIMATVSIP